MQAAGELAEARERYAELVARHQRRAARIAYHYLRDAAEADEAVQDAFVKAYQHLASFREELPFDVWFTRILINGCLDRIKARTRRERWLVPMPERGDARRHDGDSAGRDMTERVAAAASRRSRRCSDASGASRSPTALAQLPERQRSVFMLSHVRRAHVAGSQRADRARTSRPSACTCSARSGSCGRCWRTIRSSPHREN